MQLRKTVVALVAMAAPAWAISAGQTSDFQDGSEQGWSGASLTNISTGGPAGAGDRYLQVISYGGDGGGSRLATYNYDSGWMGNYTTAGVTGMEVDLRNFGGSALDMRVVLFSGIDTATSSTPLALAADGSWHTLTFSLLPGDLTVVQGGSSAADILANVSRIMVRHQSGAPAYGGTSIASQLGMDNPTAVPEPATMTLLATGLLIGLRRSRRRTH